MAISKEFIHNLGDGLKANKDHTKFKYRTQIGNKEYTKTIDFTKQSWNLKDRKKYAKTAALNFRDKKQHEIFNPFNSDTIINKIAEEYFTKKCSGTAWNKERKRLYELHIKPHIGEKKISRIIENDIDCISTEMRNISHADYSPKKVGAVAKSLSDRTVEKILLQVLKPILAYAVSNGAIDKIPPINTGSTTKKRQRKKKVTNATEKILLLYVAIHKRYKDDPFYRALFLLAFWGRRWNEIRTLSWENVNLDKHTITITAINNKIGEDQTYYISSDTVEALDNIPDNKKGLVFKSSVTGAELHSPRKQLSKIREDTGIDELTMHYFRHLFVTAGGENGMAGTIMSAALGHTRAETVEDFYKTQNHFKGSMDAVKQIELLLPNIKEIDRQ